MGFAKCNIILLIYGFNNNNMPHEIAQSIAKNRLQRSPFNIDDGTL